MKQLRIALVGSGFMGKAHAQAFRAVNSSYELDVVPVLDLMVDRDDSVAAAAAQRLGFARSTSDWRAAVADPAIDLVAIATPNILHAPIALAAIAAGKPVYCEKPLATTLAESKQMTAAAEAARVPTAVGYTYLYNPIINLARDMIANGEIGEVTAFRGIHAEDFMASPDAPFNWRCEAENAGGALADIGSHIISLARHLVGEIEEVSGKLQTMHRTRPHPEGGRREVRIDDQADAIVRFANGATGTVAASWIATGRKNQLAFEINGTKGSLLFTQERFNEIKMFQHGKRGREGFTTILAGPEHPDYGAFCPAGGHQIGYNDLKTAEVKAMLDMVTGKPSAAVDFRWALGVELVASAIRQSSEEGRWVAPGSLA